MYESGINYSRTPLERSDVVVSWNREDKSFFAAGACHILAYTFITLHPDEEYELIHIKPHENQPGNHMYVTNGIWAFDFNGWTKEDELLRETQKAYEEKYPQWGCERIIVKDDLETFCNQNNHRPPAYFLHLPWKRAYNYIKQFSEIPPIS